MCNEFPVLCADIGSVKNDKFGWAVCWLGREEMETGADIAHFAETLANAITRHEKVAVGFECPLFVPVPVDHSKLLSVRDEEPNSRPWCAGAGPTVLAAGLAEITWILREVKDRLQGETPSVFLDPGKFEEADSGILFWEALVTAEGKDANAEGNKHAGDAKKAIEAFGKAFEEKKARPNNDNDNPTFNLHWACLLWADWVSGCEGMDKPMLIAVAE